MSKLITINDLKAIFDEILPWRRPTYMTIYLSATQTLNTNSSTKVNLDTVEYSAGSGLTFDSANKAIKIGDGVSHVMISGQGYIASVGTSGAKAFAICKNGVEMTRTLNNMTNNYNIITLGAKVIPVTSGDLITLYATSGNGTTTTVGNEARHTFLSVYVVG